MCGIAGFIQREPPTDALIGRMLGRLAHRGPDGAGVWRDSSAGWHVVLGHRRLAVLDLEGGAQPLSTADGSIWITYNGEAYNHLELRRALQRQGHTFRTRSDTESVVHHLGRHLASRSFGLEAIDGMFSLALWDCRSATLLLARDRAGVKPLYYAPLPDGGIAFASELGALLEHPRVSRALDPAALQSYFFADYVHAPLTMVRGALKLQPAHFRVWTDGRLAPSRPFWSPPGLAERPSSRPALACEVRERLERVVDAQLLADVPVGVFLSGGVDSSFVAALASKRCRGRLKTFTVRLEDRRFDQSPYAAAVAQHVDSEHIEEPLTEAALLDSLDAALDCLDEPMADPSILPTFALSRLAAAHVKVVLGGDGADELWGGYPTCQAHRLARWYGLVPRAMRQSLIEPLVRRLPLTHGYQGLDWKARRFALRWDDRPMVRHLRWMSSLDCPDLEAAIPGAKGVPGNLQDALATPSSSDLIGDVLRLDFATYLPGSVLAKVDRASMAHGLEARPPMLSNEMIDLAFAVPSGVKLHRGRAKALLKRAAAPLLPARIIHRRKMGFTVPLAGWLRGPLRARLAAVLADGPVWSTGLVRRAPFLRWNRDHQNDLADHSRPLWALVVLDRWLRGLGDLTAAARRSHHRERPASPGLERSGAGAALSLRE